MANTIGQLLIELGVNTAHLKDGFDKATFMAKQFSREVKDSFGELRNMIGELGAEFGGLGGNLGSALGSISRVVGPLTESLGSAGGAAAGIGLAFTAAGVGAIGAAVQFSEAAAKLDELSHSTGMSVESISLLGDVAATKGIGIDQMGRSLERMSRSALQAAQAGPHASSAYKDLGIAVTDADGKMRSAQDIFNAVAEKFASMPDGPQKTADAIKIFGRAGAEMIPLLDQGGEKLKELEGHFSSLNAVIDSGTAKASDELKENMTLMGAAFTGVQNQLTKDLVPALNIVAKSFVEFFENNQTEIKAFADGLAEVAKVTVNVFQLLGGILGLIEEAFMGAVSQLQVFGTTIAKVIEDVAHGNFKSIWQDLKDGAHQSASEFQYSWQKAAETVQGTMRNMVAVSVSGPAAPAKQNGTGGGTDVNEHANVDFVQKMVQQADQAANKSADLAKAIGEIGAATIEATAAAKANEEIQRLQDEAVSKGIQNSRAFKEAIAAAVPELQKAALWTETFNTAVGDGKKIQEFNQKLDEQTRVLKEVAGAQTEVQAQAGKFQAEYAKNKELVSQLTTEFNRLATSPGTDPKKLTELATAIMKLNGELADTPAKIKAANEAFSDNKARAEMTHLDDEIRKVNGDILALTKGDEFARMAEQVDAWRNKLGLSEDQIAKLKSQLEVLTQQQAKLAAVDVAKGLGFDPGQAEKLKAEIQALSASWKDTGMSAQVYARTLAEIEKQQDDLAAKTGGWASGVKAGFADFAAESVTAGQAMQQFVNTGLKGITDGFAAMVTGAKFSWQNLINDMENMLLKSAIQTILQQMLKSIGTAFSGSGNGFLSGIGGLIPHASGGGVMPGQAYLVGENGPEVFSSNTAGSIIPNHALGAGGSGANVTVVQNIQTPDADSFKRSSTQIHAQAYSQASTKFSRFRT